MNKHTGRRYTASEQANSRPLAPEHYQFDSAREGLADPNASKRVAEIHNNVVRSHTHGLVSFGPDGNLILAVDPAKYRGVAS